MQRYLKVRADGQVESLGTEKTAAYQCEGITWTDSVVEVTRFLAILQPLTLSDLTEVTQR